MRGFNPRPSLPKGEAAQPKESDEIARLFQSTPFAAEGRSLRHRARRPAAWQVSIHALRCRRAKRPAAPAGRETYARFNPRPSLPKGEALCESVWDVDPIVSIHALRCRRAKLLQGLDLRIQVDVSIHALRCRRAKPMYHGWQAGTCAFQSTPFAAEGRSQVWQTSFAGMPLFQSTPFAAEGRSAWSGFRRTASTSRFNPRPSLPKGEAPSGFVVGTRVA